MNKMTIIDVCVCALRA